MIRKLTALLTGMALSSAVAGAPDPENWSAVEEEARGQTVFWYAWAGETTTNQYIDWVGRQLAEQYDIELVHVKIGDTAEAVSRVLAEKQAGNDDGGAVDLIWINGENFADMKEANLLYGPWANKVPHFSLTNPDDNQAVLEDFTVPVEGLELPWNRAQVSFFYDTARVDKPPRSMAALQAWIAANPGQFTYPKPPDFLGTSFLKQALLELSPDTDVLYQPVSEADFEKHTAALWDFLDTIHPDLWRSGRVFPSNSAQLRQAMGDGEISLAFSIIPTEASAAIANSELPPSVRSYVLDEGTLGNFSFLAIPYNAQHKAAAMVTANYLLSPEAQLRKQDPDGWGGFTVLDMDQLTDDQQKAFENLGLGKATLSPQELGKPRQEPHPSWVGQLEEAWLERYINQ